MGAEKLTAAQLQAVTRKGGPILVSAAAGSGKTLVIVERLMRQIQNPAEECSINDFLIITFTKKAAAELRARIAKELAKRLAEEPNNVHLQKQQSRIYLTQISTVHAFCADLLREFSYEAGVPSDFRMLEETEASGHRERIADELLDERYETISDDRELQSLIDGLGAGRDDRRIPELIQDVYLTAQCHLYPEKWLTECEERLDLTDLNGAEQTLWGRYLLDCLARDAESLRCETEETIRETAESESLKKYTDVLSENAALLREAETLKTWDVAYTLLAEKPELGRLPPIRNCSEPELQNRVKALRKDISEFFSAWSEEIYGTSKIMLADLGLTGDMLRALFSLTREFAERFRSEKRRLHALDFNDLEHSAIRLLLEDDGVTPTQTAALISKRFREIMVDEYQDTNQVQDSIFRALSHAGRNRFMVGDVKQSIYRFRLADPGIFLRKYRTYPNAEDVPDGGAQRILLSHNFRSGEAILEAVNDVFRRCMSPDVGGLEYGESERLCAGSQKPELPYTQVELHCLNTKQDSDEAETPEKTKAEACFAAERIRKLLDEQTPIRDGDGFRAVAPSDIVILLRSPKNSAGIFVEALQRQGIAAVSDSGESILDSSEVETLLSVLQVLDNAHQDIPLTAALLSPVFGVSAADLATARKSSSGCDLFEAVCIYDRRSAELEKAVLSIRMLRQKARDLPIHQLIEEIRMKTDFDAVYGAMQDAQTRKMNVDLFAELAASFGENGKKSLHQFLQYIAQLKEEGGVAVPPRQANAVRIMSIHKSKGLEFPVVFLCELSKRFNLEDLRSQVLLHSELGAGSNVYDEATHTRFASIAKQAVNLRTKEDNRSEELRILYVAMTRAKDLLVMSCCGSSMESRLKSIASRLCTARSSALSARAACLGDWVLQAALMHREADELHAVAGCPAKTEELRYPWLIRYYYLTAQEKATKAARQEEETLPPELDEAFRSVQFRYPHERSAAIPFKITATQLKGRSLDDEAADGRPARNSLGVKLRRPSLIGEEKALTAAQKGTAVHLAMQYLDFSKTDSPDQIRLELQRMEADRFLTPAQVKAVNPEILFRVFCGPLGELIKDAERVIREFKFSILVKASEYFPNAEDDEIMLQGVTDCCLVKEGRLTVIDFKTDRVKPGEEALAGEKYRPQLHAYSKALERIFRLPVEKKVLYFFSTGAVIEL